jgi:hypothetical protein
LRLALEFAVLEILQCPQIVQGGDGLLVVEACKQIAAFDRLALTPTTLDDAAADERRGTRPGFGLHRSCLIHDLRGGATHDPNNCDRWSRHSHHAAIADTAKASAAAVPSFHE